MTPAEELRYLILGAQREGNLLFADALRAHHLTPSQAEVLRVLDDAAPLSLAELGRRLVCESGSPSRLVDTLVKTGLVTRTVAGDDRRRVELDLTAAGRRSATSVRAAEETLHALITAAIPAPLLATAIDVLRALVAGRPAGEAMNLRRRQAPHTAE